MANKQSNLRRDYENETSEVLDILREFTKPTFKNIFNINLSYLEDNSLLVEFKNNKWIQNPQKFCLDYYGNQNYYPVILLTNNIGSMFDFEPEQFTQYFILAPELSSIRKLLEMKISV